jgi:hypothetical protein
MKKLIFLIFGIMLIFSVTAFADNIESGTADFYQSGSFGSANATLFEMTENEQEAYDLLKKSLENLEDNIYLGSFKISPAELKTIFEKIINDNPEFFYVDSQYRYSYRSNVVGMFYPSYKYDKDVIPSYLETVANEAEIAKSYLDDSMTDYEKALVLHNYIVTAYEYDYSYEIHDIYNFVVQKKGVCQAYSLLYMYLLRQEGIACLPVTSSEMSHMWNMVEIDGETYHVDPTFDDPDMAGAGDIVGVCSYKYFLKSDDYMLENGHYSWVCDSDATSTLYDESFLNNYKTQVIYVDSEWYVVSNYELYKIDVKTGQKKIMFKLDTSNAPYKWRIWQSFNIAPYGNYIIYNTHDGIYALKPGETVAQRLYTLEDGENVNINGIATDGSIVIFRVAEERYSTDKTVYRLDFSSLLSPFDFEIKSFSVKDGKAKIKYTTNSLFADEYKVYISGFNEDGSMAFVKEIEANEFDVPEAAKYKAFIWSKTVPLCENAEIK